MKYFFSISIVIMMLSCNSMKQEEWSGKSLQVDTAKFGALHHQYKEKALFHRRFKHADIDSLIGIHKNKGLLKVEAIGASVQGRSIYELTYGQGDKKVMLWSQMHGDEPTATMALFDLFNFLEGEQDDFQDIRDLLKSKLQLHFIPMLNPDGAEVYARRNAQQIDMNRDARATQTVEAAILKTRAQAVKPQYGFNLHDQNIYYNVPGTKNPVTISLLAPAYNEERAINEVRAGAMKIIVGMNALLQKYVPDAVAKYDDTYTPRGFGDNFQSWGASTVLIESGGLKGDSEKQVIRKLNFIIILNALIQIAEGSYQQYDVKDYEQIPFNASQLHDVVIRNLTMTRDAVTYKTDIGIRRGEMTVGTDYYVRGRVEDMGDLQESFGYDEIDADGLILIPGKVETKVIDSLSSLSSKKAFDLLRQGIIAAPIKVVGPSSTSKLYNLPILLYTQKQFIPMTSIDLGGAVNFFIGDRNGKLKYAVLNGYLIDLSKDELPQLKNRIF